MNSRNLEVQALAIHLTRVDKSQEVTSTKTPNKYAWFCHVLDVFLSCLLHSINTTGAVCRLCDDWGFKNTAPEAQGLKQ